MKPLSKYVFYGGAFGVALVAVALASIGDADAQTVSFVAQTDTSAATSAEIRNYQQLLCEDVVYDIASVELALSGGEMLSSQNVSVVLGKLSGTGAWDKLKKRTVAVSETVSFTSGDLTAVQFVFNPPVDKDALCSSPDEMVFLYVDIADPSAAIPLIHGSGGGNSDAYQSMLYNCVLETGSPCLGINDMAFALRTNANSAPVITSLPSVKVNEGEVVQFTLTASDSDGDTISWSSSDLEEGATLDSTTGDFSWTPTADQVGVYNLVFTATDDGGPVQETSILALTVTVLDIETPSDTNQTVLETVQFYELDTNIANSYVANLKNVETFLEKGQTKAAVSQLNAFLKKLEQDLKKESITETQYAELVERVEELLLSLETEE